MQLFSMRFQKCWRYVVCYAVGSFVGMTAIVVFPGWVYAGSANSEADAIFQKYHKSVFQVRVIARGSKEKSSIGSGFFFSPEGFIATNYHVVSDAVNLPTQFDIEYVFPEGQKGEMEVLNIDPVHDLAILKIKESPRQVLELSELHLEKGMKIFSLGNPMDMGLIIVDGLFNGLMENARYPKILFSGALNPGMSGGPALDSDGRVIGINVATQGNDISFFVPVEYLKTLYAEIKALSGRSLGPNWKDVIRKRIILDNEKMIQNIMSFSWEKNRIGPVEVPGKISDVFRCWGESRDNKKYWVVATYLSCYTEDEIFLSNTLRTGKIFFNYSWYTSRGYEPVRFYNLYEHYHRWPGADFDHDYERDLGNFECEQSFVNVGGQPMKSDLCARAYKKYEGLYDMTLRLSSVNFWDQGLIVNVILAGVTELQGKRFLLKYMKEITWQK